MTSAKDDDDTVLRLLSHLAWLKRAAVELPTGPTLGWARRVYNSSVHLQFRFVYPHGDEDRVAKIDQQSLAAAIEAVVSTAAEVVNALRDIHYLPNENTPLGSDTALDLQKGLADLLAKANAIQWCGVHAPKEDTRLDRPLRPLALLSKWRKRQARERSRERGAARDVLLDAENNPKTAFYLGLASKIVADQARANRIMPATAAKIFQQVADAQFSVDLEDFRKSQADPLTVKIAGQMLRE